MSETYTVPERLNARTPARAGSGNTHGKPVEFSGEGNGPLAALVHGFITAGVPRFEIANYSEHAMSAGEEAAAIAYIQIKPSNGPARWGAGVDTNIELASVRAVLSALNRA